MAPDGGGANWIILVYDAGHGSAAEQGSDDEQVKRQGLNIRSGRRYPVDGSGRRSGETTRHENSL